MVVHGTESALGCEDADDAEASTVNADFCACGVLVSEKVFRDLRAEYDDFGEGFDVWRSDEGTRAHIEVADMKELWGYTCYGGLCCVVIDVDRAEGSDLRGYGFDGGSVERVTEGFDISQGEGFAARDNSQEIASETLYEFGDAVS